MPELEHRQGPPQSYVAPVTITMTAPAAHDCKNPMFSEMSRFWELEEGSDCRAVVTQLSAASKAIDRAGFALIATGLEQCLKSEDPTADRADMEKLFLSLA